MKQKRYVDTLKFSFSRVGLGLLVLMLFIYAECPPPTLSSPPDKAVNVLRPVVFSWSSIDGADSYRLQVATSPTGWTSSNGLQSQYVVCDVVISSTSHTWIWAEPGKTYYWDIRAQSNGQNGQYSKCFSFTTASLPTADFSGNPLSGYAPLTVIFTDLSKPGTGSTITNYYWEFGDGTTSTAKNPSHTYQAPGTYPVKLTVTSNFGNSQTETKTNYITVNIQPSTPTVDFTASPTSGNAPLTVTFTDLSKPGDGASITSRLWNLGDGTTSTLQNPTHTYQAAGSYTVTLTVTNNFGNSKTETKTNYITVNVQPSSPTADFTANPTSGNAPLTVTFPDLSKPGAGATITSWYWDFGDGTTSTLQSPTHTFKAAGSYTITLTVTNSNNKQHTITKTGYITVTQPTPTPKAKFSSSIRNGNAPLEVKFYDESIPGNGLTIIKWSWDFGDGTTGTEQNPTHTYQKAGKYNVKLTITTSNDKHDTHKETDYIIVTETTGTPKIELNRSQSSFGVAISGAKTSDVPLVIHNGGTGILNWNVISSESWLKVNPGSGSCSGIVTISVDPSGLAAGTYSGSIIVTATGAINSPQTVSVTLKVFQTGTTGAPFGELATPGDGSTVANSVPVTGWVLDDIEVNSVKIYIDNRYIGDAMLIEGTRPDVEQTYPGYPMNYKAGWGYMLLTNFLPNGGNGSYTIIAKALDKEGHEVILGTKTIYCDNAHATKPFGAIDIPLQGGTASGNKYRVVGWVITPLPNYIPTNGSTISLIVDGVYLGQPRYNIFRPDIAGFFPGYSNCLGAGIEFYLDTTRFRDGVHTICLSVTDSAGNSEGIGSRHFLISNPDQSQNCKDAVVQDMERNEEPFYNSLTSIAEISSQDFQPIAFMQGYNLDSELTLVCPDKHGMINLEIPELERIEVRLFGYEYPEREPNPELKTDGLSQKEAQCMQFRGYLIVSDQLNDLPTGSTLDTQRGIFYWQPGPGFLGEYRLLFMIESQDGLMAYKGLKIKITPKL